MLQLDADVLLENQLARSMGLERYADIITVAKANDVASDSAFQHKFNAFYRVRRNAEWRRRYYKLFERAKKEHYTFADVIERLYAKTGNVEASFSSKMIATIDPDKPIWDLYVLRNLNLKTKDTNPQERIRNAILIYDCIETWYKEYLLTEEAQKNIETFDTWLPSYNWISTIKKIDYLLWIRREKQAQEKRTCRETSPR